MLLRYFCCVCLLAAGAVSLHGAIAPENVVVVANAKDKGSLALAKFYMQKRDIPEQNLFLVEASTQETIEWDDFLQTVFNPLRQQLVQKGWINGVLSGKEDRFGRTELAPLGHKIEFMVVCRLPLRIRRDAARLELEGASVPAALKANEAAVDSELSLLAALPTSLSGPLPNPLFGKEPNPRLIHEQVVRVARLDGPGNSPRQMVERGLQAEQTGLRGIAYIDLGHRAPAGDQWLTKAGEQLASLHYPVITETERRIMNWSDRADGAAFFFGWWSERPRGPMLEKDYRFSPGALGWDIYSFSASTIRNEWMWAPIMIRSGITGTAGNVYEPYLHLVHRPDMFVEALLKGMSAGEAAYYALPTLSWMCLYAGDPLYQPFKVGLDEQLAQVEAAPDSPLAQYVILREAQRRRAQAIASATGASTAARAGDRAALEYLQTWAGRVPGLAIAYEIARLLEGQAENRRAVAALAPFTEARSFTTENIPLAYLATDLLVQLGQREKALGIFRVIFATEKLPEGVWLTYVRSAEPLARQFGAVAEAEQWKAKEAEIRAIRAEAERKRKEAQAQREADRKAAAQKK